jgi:threonine dehydrogenase-like Zn-dependent dehydrogenase
LSRHGRCISTPRVAEETRLDGVPDGYRAMNSREKIKVMIEF